MLLDSLQIAAIVGLLIVVVIQARRQTLDEERLGRLEAWSFAVDPAAFGLHPHLPDGPAPDCDDQGRLHVSDGGQTCKECGKVLIVSDS